MQSAKHFIRRFALFLLISLVLTMIKGAVANATPVIGTPTVQVTGDSTYCEAAAADATQVTKRMACAISLITEFAYSEFGRGTTMPEYRYVPNGSLGLSQLWIGQDGIVAICGYSSGQFDLEYCGNTVYVGQATLDTLPASDDFAVFAGILAHETTHYWDSIVNGIDFVPAAFGGQTPVFPHEQAADCGAGAFIAFAIREGYLGKSTAQIVQTGFGDATTPDDTAHGTREQREAAYAAGFIGGLKACEGYLPDGQHIK